MSTDHYSDWIATNVPKDCHNLCAETTLKMQEAFPELIRVRGEYMCLITNALYPHWWLVTPDEQRAVVDPTQAQFLSGPQGVYLERDESLPEPTGRCLNCGELCFAGSATCSEDCDIAARAELNGLLRGG